MALVTVVIASRNRARLLQECLLSILSQDVDLVVTVVRTAGDEEVPTVAAVADPRVEILECPHSHRGADGWAVGLATVTTPWSMTFDDDDLMFPGSLRHLITIAEVHDLEMASGLQVVFPESVRRATLELLPPEALLAGDEPPMSLYTWNDVAALRLPGMGQSLWRSKLNRAVVGDEQPPGGDSFFATKLFSASARTGACRVIVRAYREHPDSATKSFGPERLVTIRNDFLTWATETFPPFADARRALHGSPLRLPPPG